jgi:hypothetical protein
MWTGLVWLRTGIGIDRIDRIGIELPSSIKCWETIEWPINWGPLEWCSAPYS